MKKPSLKFQALVLIILAGVSALAPGAARAGEAECKRELQRLQRQANAQGVVMRVSSAAGVVTVLLVSTFATPIGGVAAGTPAALAAQEAYEKRNRIREEIRSLGDCNGLVSVK